MRPPYDSSATRKTSGVSNDLVRVTQVDVAPRCRYDPEHVHDVFVYVYLLLLYSSISIHQSCVVSIKIVGRLIKKCLWLYEKKKIFFFSPFPTTYNITSSFLRGTTVRKYKTL